MKKIVVLCMLSAALGGVLVEAWRSAVVHAQAQEPRISSRPRGGPAISARAARLPLPHDAADLSPEERINVAVYENVNRSVVNIKTETVHNDGFFFLETEVPGEGAGSGSVLDAQGHILTNYHVVESARAIEVTLFDGNNYPARVIGKDESNDIAVLKIDAPAESLVPVELGDSTNLRVGQRVFAIGNPFGFERTLSIGIISSLNRTLPARNHRLIKSVIQIDAAINPGNSGGPLLDSHGRLIGMNTAIASPTGQSAGVGFAIPVANIARVVPHLLQRGHVIRPDSGITHVYPTEKGLLIAAMAPGGPAEKAGLRGFSVVKRQRRQGPFAYQTTQIDRSSADLIVAVDGEKISSAGEFLSLIEARDPGARVMLTIIRQGRTIEVPLVLTTDEP
ncbi:MAG: PDZ domain-containing protein [Planctomycetota bacterium]|nr:MAG: PDZ domain-containing protein [Planctomycetota bacterium]